MLCDDVQSVRLMVALKFRRVKRAVERKAGGAILKDAVLAVLQAEQAVGEHRDAVLFAADDILLVRCRMRLKNIACVNRHRSVPFVVINFGMHGAARFSTVLLCNIGRQFAILCVMVLLKNFWVFAFSHSSAPGGGNAVRRTPQGSAPQLYSPGGELYCPSDSDMMLRIVILPAAV